MTDFSKLQRAVVDFGPVKAEGTVQAKCTVQVEAVRDPNEYDTFYFIESSASASVGFDENWLREIRTRTNSQSLKELQRLGLQLVPLSGKVDRDEQGYIEANLISVDDYVLLVSYAAMKGNPKAIAIQSAFTKTDILDFCREAFGLFTLTVIEFKAHLSPSQLKLFSDISDLSFICWNEGLKLMNWWEYYYRHQKYLEVPDTWGFDIKPVEIRFEAYEEKKKRKWAPCCSIVRDWRVDETKSWAIEGNVVSYPAVNIVPAEWVTLPPFKNGNEEDGKNVWAVFAKKRWDRPVGFDHIPQVYINEFLSRVLDVSWQAYKKGIRKKPREKKRNKASDQVNTLVLRRSGDNIRLDFVTSTISLPGFGPIQLAGLSNRFPRGAKVRKAAINRRSSGFYVQLTLKMEKSREKTVKQPRAVGLDLGLEFLYATSNGHEVSPQRQYRAIEDKIAKIQRRMSKMERGSGRYLKMQERLARLHERARMARRNFNHWHSTKLSRHYQAIAVEDLAWNKMNRKAKPKLGDDGKTFEANNQRQKAGLNKSFADAAIGQFRTMLKEKVERLGGEFVTVAPHYSSQECPSCGTIKKKSLSQRTHQCSECGYVTGRDVAAAQIILARADFDRSYRGVHREVKRGESERTVNRESESETIGTATVSESKSWMEGEGNSPSINLRKGEQASSQAVSVSPPEKRETKKKQRSQAPRQSAEIHAVAFISGLADLSAPSVTPPQARKTKKRRSSDGSMQDEPGTGVQLELW